MSGDDKDADEDFNFFPSPFVTQPAAIVQL